MDFTVNQLEAITTTDVSVAVIANAGSGKTRVLTERFKHLINTERVPLYRILSFTFTEKAAGEIKERILKENILLPGQEAQLNISTIHSFLTKLLREHGVLLGLDPGFTIVSEAETILEEDERAKEFLLKSLPHSAELSKEVARFGFKKVLKGFGEIASGAHYLLRWLMPEQESKHSHKHFFIDLLNKFIDEKLDKHVQESRLSFDDLELLSLKLLKNNPEISEKIRKRYQHILVDEFQDISPLQGELIRQIHGQNILFIVGDPKQSIYRFRKADVSLFNHFISMIENSGGKIINLRETFRVKKELSRIINKCFQPLLNDAFSEMIPFDSVTPSHCQILTLPRNLGTINDYRKIEAQWITEKLKKLSADPNELANTALLFSSGNAMQIYVEEFKLSGIPYKITKTDNLLKAAEIRSLIHILQTLSEDDSLITQVGVLRSVFFNFSESFIDYIIQQKPTSLIAPIMGGLFISASDQQEWSRLTCHLKKWEKLKTALTPHQLFTVILNDLIGPKELPLQTRLNLEQWMNLLLNLQENLPQLNEIAKLFTALIRSDETIPTLNSPSGLGAVEMMTLHSAKGLEFKRVFLPQLYATNRSDSLDFLFSVDHGILSKQENSAKEEGLKVKLEATPLFQELLDREEKEKRAELKRLLYVAMTRAKQELYLFLKEPAKKNYSLDDTRSASDWLWKLLESERENQGIALKAL